MTEEEFQEQVEEMHAAFRNICADRPHDQVLLALGHVLVDALDEEFFSKTLPLDRRIDNLLAVMKEIVVRLTRSPTRQWHGVQQP